MQDLTPTPAAEPKAKTLYAFFRGLFSRMAIGQCVHAALCVAVGAAIGLSTGRTSTALGIVLGVLAAAIAKSPVQRFSPAQPSLATIFKEVIK